MTDNFRRTSDEPTSIKIALSVLCALAGAVILYADFAIPQLVSSGTPYVVLLAISLFARSRVSLWVLCILFVILLVLGYWFVDPKNYYLTVPSSDVASIIQSRNNELTQMMLSSRVIGALAIVSTAIVGTMFLRKSEQVEDSLRNLSITDYLTGVYSRRYLFEMLKQRFSDVRRYAGNNFSMIIIDIDFFRKVNENFSHLGGDLALKSLCDLMRKLIRDVDMIGRYGGEEFLVVLPNTNMDGAMLLAERLRLETEKLEVIFDGRKIPLTISAGITDYRTFNFQHLEEMLKCADEALYRAKHGGRNQVQRAIEADRLSKRKTDPIVI